MNEEIKKELYRYCERKYYKNVKMLAGAKKKWQETGDRPKSASSGEDQINRFSKKIDYYHNGMIELS